jgi:predicted RND superfamily exporter protein
MWAKVSSFIIRYRLIFIFVILGITAFMGYQAKDVKLSYDFPQVIPLTDTDYVYYSRFKKQFDEDGDLLVIGFQAKEVFKADVFNSWYQLGKDIKSIHGVKTVANVTNLLVLGKDTATHRFALKPVVTHPAADQREADSIRDKVLSLPFYNNLFYNDSTHATLMAIKLDQKTLLSKARVDLIDSVKQLADGFSSRYRLSLHYTGLPYIRTTFAQKIQHELNVFLVLSVIVTAIILLLFFRSVYNVVFPIIIIAIIVVWTLGFIVLLGYKLTLLTGLIPPLIVIIAVPNFIYFLNRYHTEYKKYGNKMKAIIMMVEKIAKVVFLNNTTTAIGFGVLYFVNSPVLKEFGVVAFIMISATYIATLVIMPLVFSYLPEPSSRQTHYLHNRYMSGFIDWINRMAQKHRPTLYIASALIGIVSIFGLTRLHAIGYIMDDIPQNDKLYTDLQFFEDNFRGVMPFEITFNTGRKNGALSLDFLQKLEEVQDTLAKMPEFSKTISIVDIAKYANQAFYNGRPSKYVLPGKSDLLFIKSYLKGVPLNKSGGVGFLLVDSNIQEARISAKMADVGSVRLKQIISKLDKDIPAIFKGSKDSTVTHRYTGFSLIFLKGNGYLISNLAESLTMAILAIIIVIAVLFPSFRLVVITLIPNVLALLITAGIMGFFNIPLKPSTVLVFSIAFGIAVDASFHFLVNYRQDLKNHDWNVAKTIAISLKETGFSIVYTSLVLFFGFGIFCFSTFGSTISLGALTSITILCAMFTNIILIPSLLISFDRKPKKMRK